MGSRTPYELSVRAPARARTRPPACPARALAVMSRVHRCESTTAVPQLQVAVHHDRPMGRNRMPRAACVALPMEMISTPMRCAGLIMMRVPASDQNDTLVL